MTRFGLKEEEKVAVGLSLFVVGKESLLGIRCVGKVVGDFILLDVRV